MEISLFLGPVTLIVIGIIIRLGKVGFLIAGYNTSSKEEKEKYDEEALCKFVGNLLFVLAGILLIIAAAKMLKFAYFTHVLIIGYLVFFAITIAAVIYLNTGNRFKKQ